MRSCELGSGIGRWVSGVTRHETAETAAVSWWSEGEMVQIKLELSETTWEIAESHTPGYNSIQVSDTVYLSGYVSQDTILWLCKYSPDCDLVQNNANVWIPTPLTLRMNHYLLSQVSWLLHNVWIPSSPSPSLSRSNGVLLWPCK